MAWRGWLLMDMSMTIVLPDGKNWRNQEITCQHHECYKDLNECKYLDPTHFCKFFQPSAKGKTTTHKDVWILTYDMKASQQKPKTVWIVRCIILSKKSCNW